MEQFAGTNAARSGGVLEIVQRIDGVHGALLTTRLGSPRASTGTLQEDETRLLPFLLLHKGAIEGSSGKNVQSVELTTARHRLHAVRIKAGHLCVVTRHDVNGSIIREAVAEWHRRRIK